MNPEQQAFVNTFVKELANENAAIFAGAGLSVPAGFVNWKQLLREIAAEIGLDVDLENDLVAVAQFHYNERQNRSGLNRALIEHFSQDHHITENHRILARLPIKTYWTTNYDTLIETALKDTGRTPDVKHTVSQLKSSLPQRDAVVYKMHGDINQPDDAVLIKDDYERYQELRGPFATALSGDLIEKCFLFVGFSFSDPNLEYILSRVRQSLREKPRDHFCIFKRPGASDYKTTEEFAYARARQDLATKDLRRFGIQTIFVDNYTEITDLLRTIETLHKQKTVLVSGSAHSYGDLSNAEAQQFIRDLAQALVKSSHKIVSGFGLGVGSWVISGALEEIYQHQGKKLRDQLILRPFPQGKDGKAQWERYRSEMVSYAGVALFVFGNKQDGENLVPANGVRREFELAQALSLALIPIGATGFVAKELWDAVMADFDSFYPGRADIKAAFKDLGPGNSLTNVIGAVIKILSLLRKH